LMFSPRLGISGLPPFLGRGRCPRRLATLTHRCALQLKQDGSIRDPDPVRDCPAWPLEVFGAKWRAV
jgi:hypothetical protein